MLAGAATAGHFALLFLSIAAWWAIGNATGRGWSALIVMAVWAVVAAVLALLRQEGADDHPRPGPHRGDGQEDSPGSQRT